MQHGMETGVMWEFNGCKFIYDNMSIRCTVRFSCESWQHFKGSGELRFWALSLGIKAQGFGRRPKP